MTEEDVRKMRDFELMVKGMWEGVLQSEKDEREEKAAKRARRGM
jgi:hypothetical protein